MSRGRRIVVVVAAVGIVSTPLVWLLNSPGAGEMTGASVQAAVGILALLWAVFQQPARGNGPRDEAVRTGRAADGGNTGIRRPGGRGHGSATAKDTGEATGGGANSGIDHTR
ncbi:hypothetical protein ACIA8O_17840 [Kitasatospora sp. NPDC051853]|uniref:hypothetical protein n=1 Tax=Kitasatospora sp. NPDC051853 TaxID=3364058 RepID=UPI00379C075D